jgi:sporulation protein YlmC with PRC-barrel domain
MDTRSRKPYGARLLSLAVIAMCAAGSASGSANVNESSKAKPAHSADIKSYHGVEGTKLLGMGVTNAQGESLGSIEDFVFNPRSGTVRYVVLSFGGTIGVGDDLYAIPLRDVAPVRGEKELIATALTKDRIEKAKHFAKDAWPTDERFWDDADKIYGIAAESNAAGAPALRAREFLGDDIVNDEQKPVGRVEDLVVEWSSSKVHYVVLKTDASLGGKRIAVPPKAFDFERDGKARLSIDRTRILMLAQYDRWPEVNDSTVVASIERGWKDVFSRPAGQEKREG